MTKNIQAYFHTENEAEQLRATLSKFSANNILVDELGEGAYDDLVVPYVPLESTGANMPNTGMGSHAVGFQEVDRDDRPRRAVITFDIAEEDVNEVLQAIRELGGHVDRKFFDDESNK